MVTETINERIVRIALSYVGIKEISGNKGWENKAFQQKMVDMGWGLGQAWCSYFGELVWKEAYAGQKDVVKMLDRLFSASATATYANFQGSQYFQVTKKPEAGALAIWRYGMDWKGHLAVVTVPLSNKFETAEGNGNAEGGREGLEVVNKKGAKARALDFTVKAKGLNLLGFVIPK